MRGLYTVWGSKEEVNGEMQIQVMQTLQHLQIKMQPPLRGGAWGNGSVPGRKEVGLLLLLCELHTFECCQLPEVGTLCSEKWRGLLQGPCARSLSSSVTMPDTLCSAMCQPLQPLPQPG